MKKITSTVTNTQQKVSSLCLSLLLVPPKRGDQSSSLKSTILVPTYRKDTTLLTTRTHITLNSVEYFFSCFYMHSSHIENLVYGMPLGEKSA